MQDIQIFNNDLLNKKSRQDLANSIIDKIEKGELNSLKIHLQVKAMEDFTKKILDNKIYKDCLIAEADKNGRKFDFFGAEFMQKEMGVKYDYSKCGDSKIIELLEQQETLKSEIKKREDFLKMLPIEGIEVINEDEVIKVYPPAKISTTTVQVTFK
jgi:hypothetical protein